VKEVYEFSKKTQVLVVLESSRLLARNSSIRSSPIRFDRAFAYALTKSNKYVNFRYSSLALEIQYPVGTVLTVTQRVWDQRTDHVTSRSNVVAITLDDFDNYNSGPTYYWDSTKG